MPDNTDRHRKAVALGTEPRSDELHAVRRSVEREPDIRTERGLARDADVVVTEAYDDPDGTSRVRHAGEAPEVHRILLTQRAELQRHRVSEEQRSRRLLAALATGLLLGSAAILAFAPQSVNVYLGAALLLAAGGAFGVRSFRIRAGGLALEGGELPPGDRER
jgi:hypothetical protein